METRENYLLPLAKALDAIGADQKLIIRELERAFGNTRALAIAEAGVFARAHGCTFRYDRINRQGEFTRAYPAGGRG